MKNNGMRNHLLREIIEFIDVFYCSTPEQRKIITSFFNRLRVSSYNLYTGFPQKLWKTSHMHACLKAGALVLCLSLLVSCTFFKGSKKDEKPTADTKVSGKETKKAESPKAKEDSKSKKDKIALDNSLIDRDEGEVKNKFGEPDIVSKTPENQIIWTYKPKWKLWPDNADTVYVEFTDGKVVRIVRAIR
jgi:hypothetical protein